MWTTQTGRFGADEMSMLEHMPADELAPSLGQSDSLVVLRALAEIMLNGDTAKLDALLDNAEINARWQRYASDEEVDSRDEGYAVQLSDYASRR
jgi:Na+-translocating ferredoxin:NAD+ oxidoreductase RnfE subunit